MPHTFIDVTSNYGFPRTTEGNTTRGTPDFDAAMTTADAAVASAVSGVISNVSSATADIASLVSNVSAATADIASLSTSKLDIPSVSTVTVTGSITNSYLNKVVLCDSASAFTITLFTPVAGDLGYQMGFNRVGAGNVILQCPAGVSVDSSRATGYIQSTSATEAGWAYLSIIPVTTSKFIVGGIRGTWATGG